MCDLADEREAWPYTDVIRKHYDTLSDAQKVRFYIVYATFAMQSRAKQRYSIERPHLNTAYASLYVYSGERRTEPGPNRVPCDGEWLSLDYFQPLIGVEGMISTQSLYSIKPLAAQGMGSSRMLFQNVPANSNTLEMPQRWKARNALMWQALQPLIELADACTPPEPDTLASG